MGLPALSFVFGQNARSMGSGRERGNGMAEQKMGSTAEAVREIAQPVADSLGLLLWDVRYEKEGGAWYLRLYVDKEGGVNIDDCEKMSRAVDPLIEEADPIPGSYYFEVSSPGVERALTREAHFARYMGKPIRVRLIRALEGQREFVGTLTAFQNGEITLMPTGGESVTVSQKQTAFVRLYEDFGGGIEKQ